MIPTNFKKRRENYLGYQTLKLINIVFNGKELEYFFIGDNAAFFSVSHQNDVIEFYEGYELEKENKAV